VAKGVIMRVIRFGDECETDDAFKTPKSETAELSVSSACEIHGARSRDRRNRKTITCPSPSMCVTVSTPILPYAVANPD